MCGLSRLLLPAMLVGVATSTLTGSDLAGWLAAGITVAVLAVAAKVRGTTATCAISLPPHHEPVDQTDDAATDERSTT